MKIIGLENSKNKDNLINDFFNFVNNSSNIHVSLCYFPSDIICDVNSIYSKSNGFKLSNIDNKILFTFDNISSLNSFFLLIKLDNLKIESADDFKTVDFVDKNESLIYKLPISFFIDSNQKLFVDSKYKIIKRDDGNYLLGFSIDDECLKKNVLFPITIDPKVSFPSSNISLQGLIYNSNTNYVTEFSSTMIGSSNPYLFGTRVILKIKDYIKNNKINIDDINSFVLKISGQNSSIKYLYVTDETSNKSVKVLKNNNIYEIEIKSYIKESLDNISLLLNYYDEEYEEIKYVDLVLDYKENIISSIYIKNPPNKIEYVYGESFDSTGLIVFAIYTSGEEKEIKDYAISKEILKRNVNKITISYKGVECYQEIKVYSKPLSLELQTDSRFKSTYIYNESPSLFGLIGVVKFEDGTKENTSNLKITDTGPLRNIGDNKLKISYTDSHFNISISNSIDIKVDAFDSIYRGNSIGENGLNLYDLSFHQVFSLVSIPGFEYFSILLIFDSLLPQYLKKVNDILPVNYFLSCCLYLYQELDKTFKYIDKNGFTHTFDYIEESNVLYDNENFGLLLYVDEYYIKDRRGTCIYFTTDGRVDYILYGKYSENRINYNYDANRKLKKIISNSNSLTYISFIYDSENYLIQVEAYLNGEKVDCSYINYKKIRTIILLNRREAYLSSIEKGNVLNESKIKTLEAMYNSSTSLFLKLIGFNFIFSHSAIRFEQNALYNLNHDCISNLTLGRIDDSNNFILEDEFLISYTGFTQDDFRHICEVIILDNKKNTKMSYMISTNGEIISKLGCKRHGTYLTLSPEYGYKLKLDGNGESFNDRKSTNFVSSIKLTEFESDSISNIESRCLSIWMMISEKCNIAYLCSKNDASKIEINSNSLNAWQKITIPLRENKLPIELFVKDEKNKVIKAKYADPIITNQKEGKVQIISLNTLQFVDIENSNIFINNKNYYHCFTIADFISTFIEYGFYSRQDDSGNYLDNPSIYLYGNKKRIKFNDDIVLVDKDSKKYNLLDLIKNNTIIFNKSFTILDSLCAVSLNFEDDLLKILTQVTKYNYLDEQYVTTNIKYYDSFGLLIKEQDEKGVVTYYEYDDSFNLIKCYRKNEDSQLIINENEYDDCGCLVNEKNNNLQRTYSYEKGLLKEENVCGLNSINDVQLKFVYQYDGYFRINKYSKKLENETLNSNVIYSDFDLKEINNENDKIIFINDYKNNVLTLKVNTYKIKDVEYTQDRVDYHYSNSDISFSYLYDNYGKLINILKGTISFVSFEYENNECDKSGLNLSRITDKFSQRLTEFMYDEIGSLKEKIIVESGDEIYKKIINSNNTIYRYYRSYTFGTSVYNQENSIFSFYFKNQCTYKNINYKIEEKFDSFSRLVNICQSIEGKVDCNIGYYSNSLLPQIISYREFDTAFKIEYDSIGRIKKAINKIDENNYIDNIEYDEIGRLKSFKRNGNSSSNIFQHIYSYDGSKLSYVYNPINYETRNFYYDSNGLLVRVEKNHKIELSLVYDRCLNITSLGDGRTFKYDVGNRLSEANIDGNMVKFNYDYNGIRTSKESSSSKAKYFYEDNILIGMTLDNNIFIHFVYSQDKILGFIADIGEFEYKFSYIKNNLGDIVGIVKDGRELIGTYDYDEYGNIIQEQIINQNYEGFVHLNPFRYRSYVYDEETKLYYLLTRYYDPKSMMFLTLDDENNYGIKNISPYCYCLFDPINKIDPTGCFSISAVIFSAVAGALISGGFTFLDQMRKNDWDIEKVDWKDVGISAIIGGVCGGLGQIDWFNNIWKTSLISGLSNLFSTLIDGNFNGLDLISSFAKGYVLGFISTSTIRLIGKGLTIRGMKSINQIPRLKNEYNIVSLVYKVEGYKAKNFLLKVRLVYQGQNWIFEESGIGEVLNDILSEILGRI